MTVRMRAVLWLLLGVGLVALSVGFLDRPVATWSHDVLRRPAWAVALTWPAGLTYTGGGAVLALLAAGVARLSGRPIGAGWRTAIGAAVATLLAVLAIAVLKDAFGRLWPETWVHNNPSWIGNHAYGFFPFHGGEGWGSFPSGHTARITAPFAVLWDRVPRLRVVWVLPPVITAVALIGANFHFLGDCIAGAYLGVACAAAVLIYL
jgi:membrane-associated phospholipid phosphatase